MVETGGYAFWGLGKGAPHAAKKDAVESLQKTWERYHERVAAAVKVEGDEQRTRVRRGRRPAQHSPSP